MAQQTRSFAHHWKQGKTSHSECRYSQHHSVDTRRVVLPLQRNKLIIMQSYRTELEQEISLKEAIVEKDILELGRKIEQFKDGSLHEDKFRALRLARGVYGQRQQGDRKSTRLNSSHSQISYAVF